VSQTAIYLTIIGVLMVAQLVTGVLLLRSSQMLQRERYDATHDPVTGLPNRRAVTRHLRTALRRGTPTGLVFLDLDRFKQVNDTYGHERGNDLLKHIGDRLQRLDPPAAMVSRLSGDEFVLIVHGDRDHTGSMAWAAHTAIVRRPVPLCGDHVPVTASVGHVNAGLGHTTSQLLHAADVAMYQAKRHGGSDVYGAAGTAATSVAGPPRIRDLRDPPPAAQP
jgi:diguanylate cyclase (GGDEF)-like protein